ncbi:metal ABC transporter solute-binding protein, Zn/Mn family [Herbiconiux sp. L3-i23]|uniref:metal ABC transporter solute-binding protein, Zn/Mn family n=1 Tax=Herbiconiux sp. L3-i23 TaxID=2905871 RepID=UPI0020677C05|nr:zinc ABC transporter substrate-binding protein [Herbiconiux sp. L3-i23]BDI24176.1 ABC transporter substrate-binding protein [Herbiconiux sp. L3-i23]
MLRSRALVPALVLALPAALVLSSCAASPAGSDGDAASRDALSVVASTDVWGDIASSIGGDAVEVTSIIDSPDKDPHEYEATARDQLALSRADLVIENGGGYDPFIDTLLSASDSDPAVIDAVEVSGLAEGGEVDHDHDHAEDDAHGDAAASSSEDEHDGHGHIEGFNEHVWYDLHTAEAVAEEIAHQLSDLDPDGAAGYEERLDAFLAGLDPTIEQAHALHEVLEGREVIVTEPVPAWLFAELGLENVSPDEFTEAVEEDSDVPAASLQRVLDLISGGGISLVAYNEQTATAQTERVRDAADEAGVPVVDFTETLPDGMDYAAWMKDNVQRVADALGV